VLQTSPLLGLQATQFCQFQIAGGLCLDITHAVVQQQVMQRQLQNVHTKQARGRECLHVNMARKRSKS
jgi:hypothetical protein